MPEQKHWLSTAEAAKELGVIQRRVRQLIEAGQIPAELVGKSYAIPRGKFDKFKAQTRKSGWPAGKPRRPETRRSVEAHQRAEAKSDALARKKRIAAHYAKRMPKGPLLTFLTLRRHERETVVNSKGTKYTRRRSLNALAIMREQTTRQAARDRLDRLMAKLQQ